MFKNLIYLLFFLTQIEADVGCQAVIDTKVQGCESVNVFDAKKHSIFETDEAPKLSTKIIKITKELSSIKTKHLDVNITIQREATAFAPSCPPFCIQKMTIKGVKTVGEVETLLFIDSLKEKKAKLLVDVRNSLAYKKETIPSSINVPYKMLTSKSHYQKEVLKLLGLYKYPQTLLIFGESAFSPEASEAIKQLIQLGYPKDKLLYYRGGIQSWKSAGLTLI